MPKFADNVESYAGVVCICRVVDHFPDFGKATSKQLFSITQEAVNNAVGIAESKAAMLIVRKDDDHVVMDVSDRGAGLAEP